MKSKVETKEEDKFLEGLNTMCKQRIAEQEAQECARTDEEAERVRYIRAARKWRCVLNLSLCAVFMVALYCLYATEHISVWVAAFTLGFCLICVGWHLNEAKRAFRRKG